MSNYTIFGLNLRQWLYIAFVCGLCILFVGMVTAYYQRLEKTIVENETNVKWLKKENATLQKSINSITDSITANSVVINRLEQKSIELAKKSRVLTDSLNKLKLRYNEIGNRVDTLDVTGVRRYFSNL